MHYLTLKMQLWQPRIQTKKVLRLRLKKAARVVPKVNLLPLKEVILRNHHQLEKVGDPAVVKEVMMNKTQIK